MYYSLKAELNRIMGKLYDSIEEIKTRGDNNNGKIDTRGEKIQISKLLAGAEQEIGDLLEKNPIDKNTPDAEKIEDLKDATGRIIRGLTASFGAPFVDKERVICSFEDDSYLIKTKTLEDGRSIAEHRDVHGDKIGLSFLKNDKEIYTDPEYVAKNLGLRTKKVFDEKKMGAVERFFARLNPFATDIDFVMSEEDEAVTWNYLGDGAAINWSTGEAYKWNAETHVYEKIAENIRPGEIFLNNWREYKDINRREQEERELDRLRNNI